MQENRDEEIAILESLEKSFIDKFKANFFSDSNIQILTEHESNHALSTDTIISILDNTRDFCIMFSMHKDAIYGYIFYLENFGKCGLGNGNYLLGLIISITTELNFNYIDLRDCSCLNFNNCDPIININFRLLNILSKGETWYNSKGFYDVTFFSPEGFDDDKLTAYKEYIQEIINRSVDDISIIDFFEKNLDKSAGNYKYINITVDDLKIMKIKELFQLIINILKKEDVDCIFIKFVNDLLYYIKELDIITYPDRLRKCLKPSPASSSNKSISGLINHTRKGGFQKNANAKKNRTHIKRLRITSNAPSRGVLSTLKSSKKQSKKHKKYKRLI